MRQISYKPYVVLDHLSDRTLGRHPTDPFVVLDQFSDRTLGRHPTDPFVVLDHLSDRTLGRHPTDPFVVFDQLSDRTLGRHPTDPFVVLDHLSDRTLGRYPTNPFVVLDHLVDRSGKGNQPTPRQTKSNNSHTFCGLKEEIALSIWMCVSFSPVLSTADKQGNATEVQRHTNQACAGCYVGTITVS